MYGGISSSQAQQCLYDIVGGFQDTKSKQLLCHQTFGLVIGAWMEIENRMTQETSHGVRLSLGGRRYSITARNTAARAFARSKR